MPSPCSDQFLGLPACDPRQADALILPLPLERTVSYGTGTAGGPRAILEASRQIEVFDEETLVDFDRAPKLHTLPPPADDGDIEQYLAAVHGLSAAHRGRFLLGLGGEHTLTYGLALGRTDTPADLTIVQIDAHADLIDRLDGLYWSHGTVMRRLWEAGCRLVQIGVRSLSREEYDLTQSGPRITTFFAHQADRWGELPAALGTLEGDVYLTVDVDGLDPGVIPHTGTPQPGGLSWRQTLDVLRAVTANRRCRLLGADVVELVPAPHPPGSDIAAARLVMKILAFWQAARG